MNLLENEKLLTIKGGAVNIGVVAGIIGIGVFIIGFIDGIIRPKKCYGASR